MRRGPDEDEVLRRRRGRAQVRGGGREAGRRKEADEEGPGLVARLRQEAEGREGEADPEGRALRQDGEGGGEVGKSRAKAVLDEEAIRKAERRDGLFLIVSSELDIKESEIVRAYSAQKGQERSFRVAKTYLKLRPVYLSREVRIKAHVLVSYLSLLILRLLERKVLGSAYPVERIVDEVRSYEAARIVSSNYIMWPIKSGFFGCRQN